MSPAALTQESLDLLNRVLAEAFRRGSENALHGAFIYRHARNISDLGDDVLALELQDRTSASRIVVRPMIESLFRIVAAIKHPAFAAEKLVAELEDEIKRIEKWLAVDQSKDLQMEMSETTTLLSEFAERLRCEHSVTTKKEWNVFQTAEAAGLHWHYVRDYFLYSKYVHSTISGIVSQEYQVGRSHVLQTAVFVILAAAGHAVQGLETDTPQAHVDEAARLLEVTINLTQQGVFQDDD